MLRFQHPDYLYLLLLVPALALLFVGYVLWTKRRLEKAGDARLVGMQLPGLIRGRSTSRFLLAVVGLSALVLAAANLQRASRKDTVRKKGVDVIVGLDVSRSMLARDVQPDRLARARQLVSRLLDEMPGNRVGLIVFAGHAYLQVPLTVDFASVKMMLQQAGPAMAPTQGTVFSEAIDLAGKSFSQRERKYKALFLISDGEDHDAEALAEVQRAVESGVKIFTVGVGSDGGGTIEDPATHAPRLDKAGQPIVSRLNEQELADIAAAGKGSYHLLRNPDQLARTLAGELDGMEQKNMDSPLFTDYYSYYQYFLAVALACLLLEVLLSARRRPNVVKAAAMLGLCFSIALPAQAQFNGRQTFNGNQYYRQNDFPQAIREYSSALQRRPGNDTARFNLGNALYRQHLTDSARSQYLKAASGALDTAGRSRAQYNAGNTYMDEKQWREAAEIYKDALRKQPGDADAKYNLSYALKKLGNKGNDKKPKDPDKEKKPQDPKPKPGQEKPDGKPAQPQAQPSKLSPQQAEQILQALSQEEKKLQEKKQKGKGVPTDLEKDW